MLSKSNKDCGKIFPFAIGAEFFLSAGDLITKKFMPFKTANFFVKAAIKFFELGDLTEEEGIKKGQSPY